jgi:hypothetical protein
MAPHPGVLVGVRRLGRSGAYGDLFRTRICVRGGRNVILSGAVARGVRNGATADQQEK